MFTMNMAEHRFLRAIGFDKGLDRNEVRDIVTRAVHDADQKEYITIENDDLYAEYMAPVSEHAGICVRGEYTDDNVFHCDYYFPYLKSEEISSLEEVSVERQLTGQAFSGIVDEFKLGISLIFFCRSIIKHLKYCSTEYASMKNEGLILSGLSDGGTILMPISKDPDMLRKTKFFNMRKSRMLREAVNGNEEAIEDLTIQDMDTQNIVNKKIHEEDVYTLVDTYFMPYGLECELYSIMGEIREYHIEKNRYTGRDICVMLLDVNDISLMVCADREDVVGEIEVGRRYKGVIWLQGYINYSD